MAVSRGAMTASLLSHWAPGHGAAVFAFFVNQKFTSTPLALFYSSTLCTSTCKKVLLSLVSLTLCKSQRTSLCSPQPQPSRLTAHSLVRVRACPQKYSRSKKSVYLRLTPGNTLWCTLSLD